jgi:hypothetical protein
MYANAILVTLAGWLVYYGSNRKGKLLLAAVVNKSRLLMPYPFCMFKKM